jgi:hypothetical protein
MRAAKGAGRINVRAGAVMGNARGYGGDT